MGDDEHKVNEVQDGEALVYPRLPMYHGTGLRAREERKKNDAESREKRGSQRKRLKEGVRRSEFGTNTSCLGAILLLASLEYRCSVILNQERTEF